MYHLSGKLAGPVSKNAASLCFPTSYIQLYNNNNKQNETDTELALEDYVDI